MLVPEITYRIEVLSGGEHEHGDGYVYFENWFTRPYLPAVLRSFDEVAKLFGCYDDADRKASDRRVVMSVARDELLERGLIRDE